MRRMMLGLACASLLLTGPPAAAQDSNPAWLKKPSSEDFDAVVPAKAMADGVSGVGVIRCEVNERGLLEKCAVASEKPAGFGFGGAALLLAASFQMKPAMMDGRPVRGTVTIPIRFSLPGRADSGGLTIHMLKDPVWDKAPSQGDLLAAWPTKAGGDVRSGHVVVRCHLSRQGALRACETVSEAPRYNGFEHAALTLAQTRFKARIAPGDEAVAARIWVTLPLHFVRPGGPEAAAPSLVHPRWIRTLNPQALEDYYPPAAKVAGVRTGLGVVDCSVAESGMLADCKVVREVPDAMGFGQAAQKVAGLMQMNPWTEDGGPVNGGRITLPIRLTLPDDEPPPPKP